MPYDSTKSSWSSQSGKTLFEWFNSKNSWPVGSNSEKPCFLHGMVRANLNKSEYLLRSWWQILPHSKVHILEVQNLHQLRSLPFTPHYITFSKSVSHEVNLASQYSHLEVVLISNFLWKVGFPLMQILGLLGMYFDATG